MRKIGNRRWLSECCFVPGPATGQLPIVSLCHGMSICPAARLRYVNIKLRRGPHVYIGPAEENRLSLQRLSFPRPKKKKNDFSQMAANAHCERQRSGRSRRKKKKKSQRQLAGRVKGARAVKSFYSKKKTTTQIATKENRWCVSFIPRLRLTKQPSRAWIYIISKRERKRRNPPDTRSISPAGLYQHDDQPFLFFSFLLAATNQTNFNNNYGASALD